MPPSPSRTTSRPKLCRNFRKLDMGLPLLAAELHPRYARLFWLARTHAVPAAIAGQLGSHDRGHKIVCDRHVTSSVKRARSFPELSSPAVMDTWANALPATIMAGWAPR